jgi:phage terminase large subunit
MNLPPPTVVQTSAEFPAKLQVLFQPKRYKTLYGGRAGMKSWGIARALLLQGYAKPLRVLCARQQQNSIAESVHKLLSDQIVLLNLSNFYEIQRDRIIGANGTSFFFEGIYRNVDRLKSYEGIDICWVEEAHAVTEDSWEKLTPTIRKPGSEIWISFNPSLEDDYTYRRFVLKPPVDSFVVFLTYRDNPWLSEESYAEVLDLKERDYDAYLNVWEGRCKRILTGAVYAEELRKLIADGRLTNVPYNPTLPVDTFWDLGWSDSTAIWFRQRVGFEWHYIDYYENHQKPLAHYQTVLQERGYVYGTHWLPHDAVAKEKGSGVSIEERLRKWGPVRVVKKLSVADGTDAARTLLGSSWFDELACAQGFKALSHYRYEVQQEGPQGSIVALSKAPVHDWSSHGADSFRYSAVAVRQPRSNINATVLAALQGHATSTKRKLNLRAAGSSSAAGWMNG